MKRCTKCGKEKPSDAFYAKAGNKCKDCCNEAQRRKREVQSLKRKKLVVNPRKRLDHDNPEVFRELLTKLWI